MMRGEPTVGIRPRLELTWSDPCYMYVIEFTPTQLQAILKTRGYDTSLVWKFQHVYSFVFYWDVCLLPVREVTFPTPK